MSITSTSTGANTYVKNPLGLIEQIVDDNEWISDRRDNNEIAVQAPGHWCDYSMFFAWNEKASAIHFTCAFDMRIPTENKDRISELLAMLNEKMWLGHFGIWDDEGLPMYRHTLPLRGTQGPTKEQLEDVIETAISECERFYPAFQLVIWGGKTAQEAVDLSILDTVGEA